MNKTDSTPRKYAPSEADVRAYAYHLYEQNGRLPGHDLDNWLEAEACLLGGATCAQLSKRRHQMSRENPPNVVLTA